MTKHSGAWVGRTIPFVGYVGMTQDVTEISSMLERFSQAGGQDGMVKFYAEALSEILSFISEQVPGPKPRELTENTTLRGDLRMCNDDAKNLMHRYFERFDVSVQNFDFETYFPEEGDGIIGALLFGFLNRKRPQADPKPLTIAMLAHAASVGAWV
jgi:hypothetical protein